MLFKDMGESNIESTGYPVRHLDGSVLNRPMNLPPNMHHTRRVIITIAVILSVVVVWSYIEGVVNEPARQKAAVEASLAKSIDTDYPQLTSLVALDVPAVAADLKSQDRTLVELSTAEEEQNGVLDIVEIPEGVNAGTAKSNLEDGIETLKIGDAITLLHGSWRVSIDRGQYLDLRLRYADFDSDSAESAIKAAIEQQGLQNDMDSGLDSSGNSYHSGGGDTDAGYLNWRVSACPLTDMYPLEGMPTDAYYIVVRLYQ